MIRDTIETGLARAYIRGAIDYDGDLEEGLHSKPDYVASPWRLARAAVSALDIEHRPVGDKHSPARDRRSVQFHYDLPLGFYSIMLGPSMVYSCALWDAEHCTLEDAQMNKIERILEKLDVRPGERLADIGCGWGVLCHAARRWWGADAEGYTLSEEQAAHGRAAYHPYLHLMDYRDIPSSFDKVVSVGMVEHVGRENIYRFFQAIHDMLRLDGRALVHGITKPALGRQSRFIQRFVFPDGDILPLGMLSMAAYDADLKILDCEAIGENYPPTLRAWRRNLEMEEVGAIRLVGVERYRAWRLYLAASAIQFEKEKLNVHQLLLERR